MKIILNIALGLTLLVGAALPSLAQNLGGGLLLGLNASQVDGDEFVGFNKAGLQVGGFVYYQFSEALKLQPEIVFEQLGSGTEQFLIVNMNYISLPVLLNLRVPVSIGSTEHQIEVHAGPAVGILLSARNDFGQDITDAFDGTDFRAVAGIAYRLGDLSLAIRYGYSLASFLPGQGRGSPILRQGAVGAFHNYVSFSLRWHLFD